MSSVRVLKTFHTDGTIDETAKTMTFEAVQEFCGGYVVQVHAKDKKTFLFANEDGLPLRLRPNPEATKLVDTKRSIVGPVGLVGNVVLVQRGSDERR